MERVLDTAAIEKKWKQYWDDHKTWKVTEDPAVPKDKRLYVLDMFPYPSGSGLHVGHPEGYTATDIYTRYKKMSGFNVLHPMGFDSFGLPAENYAIQTGTHPAETTYRNIDRFREQIKSLGFIYDWDRECATSDADYYHWTQWIFLQLFNAGLAYESEMPINWCPSCLTGLANEEVNNGKCDRCDSPIERKRIRQWMLKITAYAERLDADLDLVDWSDAIKHMQRNWIGKSEGAEVQFKIDGSSETVTVYTTRPDTLFGATYMVLSPEHPLVPKITSKTQRKEVDAYVEAASHKSDLQRTDLAKEKTGVFTGAYGINPVNGAKVPVWIADYVLAGYGTGAIMAVPAHDTRDFEFAKKFGIPVIQVVSKDGSKYDVTEAETLDGVAVNSGKFDGMKTADFKKAITDWLEKENLGKKSINYKMRDWVFSRQRYWGEPIPVVHCDKCGIVGVPESELPLKLPDVKSYKPTGTGESPLAAIEDWVNCSCPKCGGKAKRETNTMPQWAGSSWYFLRFCDTKNTTSFAARDAVDYWMPVDLYVGGAEHAVLHLLYARFWHKFLFDRGFVGTPEPFMKLKNQGMILGENGEKMSKSRGNVINPDDVIREHGTDTLRIYEMFMGPLSTDKPWNTQSIFGVRRFLERVWRLFDKPLTDDAAPVELEKLRHKTIRFVGEKIDSLDFNVAVSQMMIFLNGLSKEEKLNRPMMKDFVKILHPFAPFMTEEIWETALSEKPSLVKQPWPVFDPAMTVDDEIAMVIQVNGKVRENLTMPRGTDVEKMKEMALGSEKIQSWISGKEVLKVIAVPDKLVNIVIKG